MKLFIFYGALFAFLLTSCGPMENTAVDKEGNIISSDFIKKISFPIHPCEQVSRAMVMTHFDVAEEDLELNEDFLDPESYHANCGYRWKKPNFEELEELQRDAMMSYVMSGMSKKEGAYPITSLSDITKLESPYSTVMVGNFEQYDDLQSAVDSFTRSHHVLAKEELSALNKAIDKQFAEKGIDDNSKEIGKSLTSGIAGEMKFTEIDGIGDRAYYDHMNKSLDVLFGTFSMKIFVDSPLDFDSNIEIAKKIALEVWDNL